LGFVWHQVEDGSFGPIDAEFAERGIARSGYPLDAEINEKSVKDVFLYSTISPLTPKVPEAHQLGTVLFACCRVTAHSSFLHQRLDITDRTGSVEDTAPFVLVFLPSTPKFVWPQRTEILVLQRPLSGKADAVERVVVFGL
jgi:hypothetical protein